MPESYDELDLVSTLKDVHVQGTACKYGWQPCVDQAGQQFSAWMEAYPNLGDADTPVQVFLLLHIVEI
jgi:hypothetical protein